MQRVAQRAKATLDGRARSYLAGNCAFCHNPKGEARTTGLFLTFAETDPARLGRCKSPVAAGAATGDLRFDVVPGQPDASILLARMIATGHRSRCPRSGAAWSTPKACSSSARGSLEWPATARRSDR